MTASFTDIVKEHKKATAQRTKELEDLKKDCAISVEKASAALLESVNHGVSRVMMIVIYTKFKSDIFSTSRL